VVVSSISRKIINGMYHHKGKCMSFSFHSHNQQPIDY